MNKLKFSINNRKLRHGQAILDLPAGHSCPFALLCKASVDRLTGELTDGACQVWRCYAASTERQYKHVRAKRWHNFELLKACKNLIETVLLIGDSILALPKSVNLIRAHSSGDFFSQEYFDAWLAIAYLFPDITFYAYTKAIPYWIKRLDVIPANFRLNASYGGLYDRFIAIHKLKSVTVVNSVEEAEMLGLEIDHDDTHAWNSSERFALLLHGNGPSGTLQAKLHNNKARKIS